MRGKQLRLSLLLALCTQGAPLLEVTVPPGGAVTHVVTITNPTDSECDAVLKVERTHPEDAAKETESSVTPWDVGAVAERVYSAQYSGLSRALVTLASAEPGGTASIDAVGSLEGVSRSTVLGNVGVVLVDFRGATEQEVKVAMDKLSKYPGILHVESDEIAEIDSLEFNKTEYDSQWGLEYLGMRETWSHYDGSDVPFDEKPIVAVIDTGVDFTHHDVHRNMWINLAELNGVPGIDDDGNGYVDDIYGINTLNGSGNPMDENGHGTHVAGIVAGAANGMGTIGVNPEGARIMACRFMDASGRGPVSAAVTCMDYAIANGANVTNHSWGVSRGSSALKMAISRAAERNQLFVTSAGNNGDDVDVKPNYPASFAQPGIIAVAATDKDGKLAGFSSFGARSISVGAPGVGITSAVLGNETAKWSGTSMAAPHVAGLASLIFSANPLLTAIDGRKIIEETARPSEGLEGKIATGGIVHGLDALKRASAYQWVWPSGTPFNRGKDVTVRLKPREERHVPISIGGLRPGTFRGGIRVQYQDPVSHVPDSSDVTDIRIRVPRPPDLDTSILQKSIDIWGPSGEPHAEASIPLRNTGDLPLRLRAVVEGDADVQAWVPGGGDVLEIDADATEMLMIICTFTDRVASSARLIIQRGNGETEASVPIRCVGGFSWPREIIVAPEGKAMRPAGHGLIWKLSQAPVEIVVRSAFIPDDINSTDRITRYQYDEGQKGQRPTSLKELGGRVVEELTGTDDEIATVHLQKFRGRFYDALTPSSIAVSSNGFVSFVPRQPFHNSWNPSLNSNSRPNAVVAPLWKDLAGDASSHVWLFEDETELRVEWEKWGGYQETNSEFSFQMRMEAGGNIEFVYETLSRLSPPWQVGVENAEGNRRTFDSRRVRSGHSRLLSPVVSSAKRGFVAPAEQRVEFAPGVCKSHAVHVTASSPPPHARHCQTLTVHLHPGGPAFDPLRIQIPVCMAQTPKHGTEIPPLKCPKEMPVHTPAPLLLSLFTRPPPSRFASIGRRFISLGRDVPPSGSSLEKFIRVPSATLSGPPLLQYPTGPNLVSCAEACLRDSNCQSADWDYIHEICKLHSATQRTEGRKLSIESGLFADHIERR